MKLYPTCIDEHLIYDIFHADGKLIIMTPERAELLDIYYNNVKLNISKVNTICYIHSCKYVERIELKINGINYKNLKVNLYDISKDNIVLTTMVKNEDNYIVQWIEYHLHIGFDKILVYDNKNSPNTRYKSDEDDSNLEELLEPFISKNQVILIEWKYSKEFLRVNTSGQKAQQQHSLFNSKESNYLALIDIDEYLNISNFPNSNIGDVLSQLINPEKHAGLKMWCKFFQNCDNEPDEDYDFFKITNFFYTINGDRNIPSFRSNNSPKIIIVPKYTSTCAIHGFQPVHGKRCNEIKKYNSLYFNHYYFLNKKNLRRWRNTRNCQFRDDTLVKYYDILKKP